MTRNLRFLRAALLLATFGFLVQLSTAAHAMNFYNDTPITIYVDFDCGFFCENDWDNIAPNDMRSRPDESGNLSATIPDGNGAGGCSVDVDTHGWVVASGSDPTSIVLSSFHQDGSVRETCVFVYSAR